MSTATIQPPEKDTDLYGNTNHGTDLTMIVRDYANAIPTYRTSRPIASFDLSSIPVQSTISSATLSLYYAFYSGQDPVGRTVWAYKLTKPDWEEDYAAWTYYKRYVAWDTAGGDYVTSNPAGASLSFPAAYGWASWDVTDIVTEAHSRQANVDFLIKFEDETKGAADYAHAEFVTKEDTSDPTLYPKLSVTHSGAAMGQHHALSR